MISTVSTTRVSFLRSFLGSFTPQESRISAKDCHLEPSQCIHGKIVPISSDLDLLNKYKMVAVAYDSLVEMQDQIADLKHRIIPVINRSQVMDANLEGYSEIVVLCSTGTVETVISDFKLKQKISIFVKDATVEFFKKSGLISAASKHLISVIVPLDLVGFHQGTEKTLDIGNAVAACLSSDRTDNLIPTVVVNQFNQSLGLVYSSAHSISEAMRTSSGVYQSRKRGLWYKGATSNASQQLISVDADCDSDCLQFTVIQKNGFCHLPQDSCFGSLKGLTALENTLKSRKNSPTSNSYTAKLLKNQKMLSSKLLEEMNEFIEASTRDEIANEAADVLYFLMTKLVANSVDFSEIERILDQRSLATSKRPGLSKRKYDEIIEAKQQSFKQYDYANLGKDSKLQLIQRPIIKTDNLMSLVAPIMNQVKQRGDEAVLEFTSKFDKVQLESITVDAPFPSQLMKISQKTKQAIDVAFENILKFHKAQQSKPIKIETMPGVECSRFSRPIQTVGLYVPGGSAVLPSTALMLGIPAMVAGCQNIIIATPPRKDGSICPEVVYVASKVKAKMIVKAGGAQAVAAMAYGTATVPKVDKICGPGNQYVTCAKMIAQNDTSALCAIDMPAGPSELLVIADETCDPVFVVSDLLSQAEHGPDSQVVLLGINLSASKTDLILKELVTQTNALPRAEIAKKALEHSHFIHFNNLNDAIQFSNEYAPEHLILHLENPDILDKITNAGSVFVGEWSTESLGDYASGTNHTLPTYGYAKMYSGVNTDTFCKHLTAQKVTKEGISKIGPHVIELATVEGLEAHANAVRVRLARN